MIQEIEGNPDHWIVNMTHVGIVPMDTTTALQILALETELALLETNNLPRLIELNEDITLISRRNGILASQYVSRYLSDRLQRQIRRLQAIEERIFQQEDEQREGTFDPQECHAFCFCKGKH
nr:hypothetical protein [Angelica bushy stunt virus]